MFHMYMLTLHLKHNFVNSRQKWIFHFLKDNKTYSWVLSWPVNSCLYFAFIFINTILSCNRIIQSGSVRRSIWKRGTGASFQHATTHRRSTIGEKHRLGYIFINQLTNSSTLRPLRCGACCTTHLLTHLHERILLPWSVRASFTNWEC